jgi:hypothetical protein
LNRQRIVSVAFRGAAEHSTLASHRSTPAFHADRNASIELDQASRPGK